MNLLTDRLVAVSNGDSLSLPGLFAAMARDEIQGFPALRPHQRPAWHMFLCQLAALAAWKSAWTDLPERSELWVDAIRALTPEWRDDEPWRLVLADSEKPAFLQPPDPGGLKWVPVAAPDQLDLLISSKNHDLKRGMMRESEPQDWIFALVSLQTTEGFGGRGNYGIARMNKGTGSRPMLSLVGGHPGESKKTAVPVSAWWRSDVARLLRSRCQHGTYSPVLGKVGGAELLWTIDWPEGEQLDVDELDPLFVEICRRVRLTQSKGAITAYRANSGAERCNAKQLKGNTGDPWAPVGRSTDNEGKCLSIGKRGFDYRKLCDLLFSGDWTTPYFDDAEDLPVKGDLLLVAEALSRGEGRTNGFQSRTVHVPSSSRGFFRLKRCGDLAKAQIEEIKAFDGALGFSLAVAAAAGEPSDVQSKHFECAAIARHRFDRRADQLFFSNLWRRLDVRVEGAEAVAEAKREFLQQLLYAAETELEATLPTVPCVSIQRPKAEYKARAFFSATLRNSSAVEELFDSEKKGD